MVWLGSKHIQKPIQIGTRAHWPSGPLRVIFCYHSYTRGCHLTVPCSFPRLMLLDTPQASGSAGCSSQSTTSVAEALCEPSAPPELARIRILCHPTFTRFPGSIQALWSLRTQALKNSMIWYLYPAALTQNALCSPPILSTKPLHCVIGDFTN